MESNKIVLSDDSINLLLQQAGSEDVQLIVEAPGESDLIVNSNNSQQKIDTAGNDTKQIILSGLDPFSVDKMKKKNKELDLEIKSLKAAIFPVLEVFLKNEKLVEGMGRIPTSDKNSVEFMTDMLYKISRLIKNLDRVEQTMRNLQEKLTKSVGGNIDLLNQRRQTHNKLEKLSQSAGLEDILSQLRTIFQDTGIEPGPLFRTKNDADVKVAIENDSKYEDLLFLDITPIDIDHTLYKAEMEPQNTDGYLSGNVREDGTFDDSDVEFADYEEEDDKDLDMVRAQLEAEGNLNLVDTNSGDKKYGLRPKKNDLQLKSKMSVKQGGRKPRRGVWNVFECKYCGKEFERQSYLRDHERLHTGEKPFKCDECGQAFRIPTHLKEHKRIHTGERPYVCELCNKSFRRATDFWEHKRKHDKRHVCPVCSKKFQLKKQLTIHYRKHTGEKPFVCDVCGKGFAAKAVLTNHLSKMHLMNKDGEKIQPKKKKNTNCPVCNKVVRLYGLKEHMAIHSDVKPYQCEICARPFVQRQALLYHIKRIHSEERNFPCNVCNKAFVRSGDLKTHMKRHDADYHQKLTCDVCQKVLCNESSFRHHMALHGEAKNFKCDSCDKTFYTDRSLKEHTKRIHEGRCYQCDVCGRALASFTGLKNHKLIHTGEKPFSCEQCGAKFRKLDTLKSHANTHGRKATKYHCGQCGEKFENQNEMYSHRQKCDSNVFVMESQEYSSDSDM